jgi:hypothetical protein
MKTKQLLIMLILLTAASCTSEPYRGYHESSVACTVDHESKVKCESKDRVDLMDLHKQSPYDRILIDEP